MKTVLKVIGWILVGLVGLAVIFGVAGFFFFRRFAVYGRGMMNFPGMMPRGFNDMRGYPFMHPGFGGFGLSFLGWLIPLGLFVLLVLGGIGIILSLRRPSVASAPAAPMGVSTPAAMVEPAAPVEQEGPTLTCPNCAKIVQKDWVTCPYCSHPLTQSS